MSAILQPHRKLYAAPRMATPQKLALVIVALLVPMFSLFPPYSGRMIRGLCNIILYNYCGAVAAAVMVSVLQVAYAAFIMSVIRQLWLFRRDAVVHLHGVGHVACGTCGYPYETLSEPAVCPECGARLGAPESIVDLRQKELRGLYRRFIIMLSIGWTWIVVSALAIVVSLQMYVQMWEGYVAQYY